MMLILWGAKGSSVVVVVVGVEWSAGAGVFVLLQGGREGGVTAAGHPKFLSSMISLLNDAVPPRSVIPLSNVGGLFDAGNGISIQSLDCDYL